MEFKKYAGYIVSSNGKVYSKRNGKQMVTSINHKGYEQIYLIIDGKKKTTFVHRLVAICFVNNPYNKPQVNHKDGNKLNNDFSNLEWCTNNENNNHAFRYGLKTRKKVKLILKDNSTKIFESINECARYLGTTQYCVSRVCSGKRNTILGNKVAYCD